MNNSNAQRLHVEYSKGIVWSNAFFLNTLREYEYWQNYSNELAAYRTLKDTNVSLSLLWLFLLCLNERKKKFSFYSWIIIHLVWLISRVCETFNILFHFLSILSLRITFSIIFSAQFNWADFMARVFCLL